MNKIDKLEDKAALLPQVEKLAVLYDFAEIVPLSARRGINMESLEQSIYKLMPEGEMILTKINSLIGVPVSLLLKWSVKNYSVI